MKFQRRRFLHLAGRLTAFSVVATLLALTGRDVWAQTRTVKMIVAVAPGGSTDILAHTLAEEISREQKQTIVIENRPGAGGIIGIESVARAAPDGNTLLIGSNAFLVNPHLRKVNYDPLTSFEPVCYLAAAPYLIVVNTPSAYRTLADLLNGARGKPGDLNIASFGPRSSFHIAIEALKREANVNITYVPYPGEAPVVNALLGGHVTSAFATYLSVAEQLKAGNLRALVTTSRTRIEPLPDLPTITEAGYKDSEAEGWFGLFAPAKTPNETTSQIAGWFTAAMQAPYVEAKLFIQGIYPAVMCGADFGRYLRNQYDEYGRVIREANMKAE